MRKLAVLALALILIPSVVAIIAQTHEVKMQTQFVTQGYSFARVQGLNYNDVAVNVLHWHMTAELGPNHAFCELQPAPVPPGPFDVEIAVQCQTRSQFTTMFTKATKVKIETFVPDGVPENSLKLENFFIETGPRVPTPFPLTPLGHAVIEEQANTTGTFMFIAGLSGIVALTIAVIVLSLRREE